MKDAMVTSIIDAFLHGYISHFGVPKVISTDRAVQFELNLFSQVPKIFRMSTLSYHELSSSVE